MTKVSDYFNEWREDPEKGDGEFPRAVILIVGIIVAAAIVLLLWWGYGVQEKKREDAARKAQELQEAPGADFRGSILEIWEHNSLTLETAEDAHNQKLKI